MDAIGGGGAEFNFTSTRRGLLTGVSWAALALGQTLMVTMPDPAAAQTWTGATNQDWTTGSNWNMGVPPSGTNTNINQLTPNPTVLGLSGAATGSTGHVYIGRFDGHSGNLTIQDGSTLTTSAFGRIGEWAGSTGAVTVTGAGSLWAINGSNALIIGNFGDGTLSISNGASVVTSSGSAYTIIGRGSPGTGILNITGGGTLVSSGSSSENNRIGRDAGSQGIVNISGPGSQWTLEAARLEVGTSGAGTLNVSDSGKLEARSGIVVASNASSVGTFNLTSGGTAETSSLAGGSGAVQGNFDNGTLQALANNANFITGFSGSDLNIAAGGLIIDTISFDVGTDATSTFSGDGGLTITGGGSLTLQANNTYSGETRIQSGTLALSGAGAVASSSRVIADGNFDISGLAGTGTSIRSLAGGGNVTLGNKALVITAANGTFSGIISGTGALMVGGAMLDLTGDSSGFVGTTSVEAGTLAVNGSLCGDMNVLAGGRLQGTGTVCDTTNAGVIAPGNSIGTLLIAGDYVGTGGTLEMEAVLAGTGSPADRLVITGNASGTTNINVINLGGTGATTGTGNTDGISIVQVGGTSTANTFQLPGGYVAAGPYQYTLNAFAPGASAAGEADPLLGGPPFWDYRLQTLVDASGNPIPVPQVAGYQALPSGALRYGASTLDALHKRLGEIRHLVAARKADPNAAPAGEAFIRGHGSHGDVSGDDGPGYDQDIWFVQLGGKLLGWDVGDRDGTMRVGAALSIGGSSIDVDGSGASVDLKGTSLALTATYQAVGGWYVDAVAQGTRYGTSVTTRERGETGSPDGWGLGLSLEGGYPLDLGNKLIVEPQAQLAYQHAWFDRFTDVDGLTVDLKGGDSLRGRLGGRVQKTFATEVAEETALLSPYVEANVLHEFLNGDGVTASGVTFASDTGGTSVQLGGGLNAQMTANFAAFASISYEQAGDRWRRQQLGRHRRSAHELVTKRPRSAVAATRPSRLPQRAPSAFVTA